MEPKRAKIIKLQLNQEKTTLIAKETTQKERYRIREEGKQNDYEQALGKLATSEYHNEGSNILQEKSEKIGTKDYCRIRDYMIVTILLINIRRRMELG